MFRNDYLLKSTVQISSRETVCRKLKMNFRSISISPVMFNLNRNKQILYKLNFELKRVLSKKNSYNFINSSEMKRKICQINRKIKNLYFHLTNKVMTLIVNENIISKNLLEIYVSDFVLIVHMWIIFY